MRLFHVSEESDIEVFHPRIPRRTDIDNSKGLVWAINEECLPNFLTPRECPRVTYYATEKTSEEDIERYFSYETSKHVVAIERHWYETMNNTILYLYEFEDTNFYLQDEIAGYYVSEVDQFPINKVKITDLFGELLKRNVEVKMVDDLLDLRDKIILTTLNWSMCKMGNV